MLVKGYIKKQFKEFVTEVNKTPVKDQNKAIDFYSERMEKILYDLISKITIIIPPGSIIVSGSPSTQTNLGPITLKGVLK